MKYFLAMAVAVILVCQFVPGKVRAEAIMTPQQASWCGYGAATQGALNVLFFIPGDLSHLEDRYVEGTNVYLGKFRVKSHADPWAAFLFEQPLLWGVALLDGLHPDHIMFGECFALWTDVGMTLKHEVDVQDHWQTTAKVVFIHQEF